jgi:GNAT superfamily N-acetyltransferase
MPTATVRAFTPELLPDWLAFFDHDAFADNPEWAPCYCTFFHADSAEKPFEERGGPENRAAACALLAAGRMAGYLAYAGGKVVGWCHAAPRLLIPNVQLDPRRAVDDAERVGAVVCFVIAAPYRRRGIARALLDAALDGFRRQGLAIAEAYPRQYSTDDADNYHGPLALYLQAGFEPFREAEGLTIVRMRLAAGDAPTPPDS